MDLTIHCPHCGTKLVVGDDLVGQAVLCEDCEKPFTVQPPPDFSAPPPPSAEPPREAARPRSRRRPDDFDDDDDEDDAPIRRKPKRTSGSLVPAVFGSLLVLATAVVAVGLFFAFGFAGGGRAGGPSGAPFRLSNPIAHAGGGFSVDVETADGNPPPPGRFQVTWQSDDGTFRGILPLQMAGRPRTTFTGPPAGPWPQALTVWVDHDPPTGTKQSNAVTVR